MLFCPVPTPYHVLNGLSFLLLTRECYDLSLLYSQNVHPIQTEPAFFTLIPLKPWTFETTGPVPATCHPETPLPCPVGQAYHATQTHSLAFSHLCISFLISWVLQLSNSSTSVHTWKCLHFPHTSPQLDAWLQCLPQLLDRMKGITWPCGCGASIWGVWQSSLWPYKKSNEH